MSTWQEAQDDQGRTYYYNVTTHETSWEKPAEPSSSGSWKAYKTEDGRDYYHNEETGETTWERPSGFGEQGDVNMEEEEEKPPQEEELSELDKELQTQKVDSGDLEKYKDVSEEEAQELYFGMLKENNVDSTWSFEKVISTFVKNPAYWAVRDPSKRKQLYDEFLVNKLQLEAQNKTQAIENAKSNFTSVLVEYRDQGKLHKHSRWVTLKDTLIKEENPIFKHSVLGDGQLRSIFNDFVKELAEEEESKLEKRKSEALAELETYLNQVVQSLDTSTLTWEKLNSMLQNDSRFKANKHFAVLDQLDILELYMAKVYPKIENDIKTQITKAEKANYRADRKAREAFKKLLVKQVKINAGTLFKDVLPQFEDEDAFIELCGRNGSTPLELFWDIVDEKSQDLKVKKDLVEAVLRESKIDYDEVLSSKETFVDTLTNIKDDRLSAFDLTDVSEDGEVSVIYSQLVHAQTILAQKARTEFEKSIANRAHDLANWLQQNLADISILVVAEEEVDEDKTIIYKKGDKYSLKKHLDDLQQWSDELSKTPVFQKAESTASKVYKNHPAKKAALLGKLVKESITDLVAKLNQKSDRKRPAPEPESDAKKQRPEEKKPVFINY
ncbi:hypothetical protein CA3LBN_002394 [Candidozyma haemuli]|uniref:WW domain-containing protein n=1 Tax=Candidozyma haemuli TaxID=45357 RepID=A0ABX8I4C6_9ASCO|nr:hypothetical protein CA3LBN_002394 [[Candida] haemuloni]